MIAWSCSAMKWSDSGISAIFASAALSPSALPTFRSLEQRGESARSQPTEMSGAPHRTMNSGEGGPRWRVKPS